MHTVEYLLQIVDVVAAEAYRLYAGLKLSADKLLYHHRGGAVGVEPHVRRIVDHVAPYFEHAVVLFVGLGGVEV